MPHPDSDATPLIAAPLRLVVMGVAGCGKSTLGQQLSQALGLPFIEGDQYHPPANVAKMRSGQPLTDADRAGWLDTLNHALARQAGGAVLACSALKRAYRERLRAGLPALQGVPALRFVHLRLTPALANERVAARAADHLFPASLVASQFATLEDPAGEPGVLTLDAALPDAQLCAAALDWLTNA